MDPWGDISGDLFFKCRLSGGYLDFPYDEDRSESRYLTRIALLVSSRDVERTISLRKLRYIYISASFIAIEQSVAKF